MKKIMIVFGTRPEAIKMCPLVKELKSRACFDVKLCVTGQHREMLYQVLKAFNIAPDYDLAVMKPDQDLFDITCSILTNIKDVLKKEQPDIVLVHGDTSTAFAVALACFYLQIPLGHVEAGLRTYDINNPFPEEFNRHAISLISKYNFVPTNTAKQNLLHEMVDESSIYITGNTVIDAMHYSVLDEFSHPEFDWAKNDRLVLITAHRRENIGVPMRNMFRAIRRVIEEHPDVKAIFPVHYNSLVRQLANEELGGIDRIHLCEPIDVFTCHNFEAKCFLCLTDSGGIQEECPSFGKPVLVMRDATERPEGIEAGTAKLVGTNEDSIYKAFSKLLDDREEYNKMSNAISPYGDGKASKRIADILEFGKTDEWQCG